MNETENGNTKPHADPATQEAERDTPDVRQASVPEGAAAFGPTGHASDRDTPDVRQASVLEALKEVLAASTTPRFVDWLRDQEKRERQRPDRLAEHSSIYQEAVKALLGSVEQDFSGEVGDQAQQSMFRDIDAILARLETGIAAERTAMDALLDRLTSKAA